MRISARWTVAMTAVLSVALLIPVASVRAEDGEEGGHGPFIVSFADAKTTASEGKKDILMEFTGSDWCPPCKALSKNVFSTDEFKKAAPEKFVLLMLDYPRDKSNQTEEEIAQNQKLQGEYNISGYPTIILADAAGRPYARMVGYGNEPVAAYMEKLDKFVAIRVTRDENMAKAANAEGAEKAKFLGMALKDIDPELAVEVYRPEIDQIIELDADDSTGMKSTFIALIKSADVKKQLTAIQQSIRSADDVEAALAKIDDLIDSAEPGAELRQEIMFMKAQLLFGSDKEKSKETLLAAQKLAPESEIAGQIGQILTRFFADEEASEEADK